MKLVVLPPTPDLPLSETACKEAAVTRVATFWPLGIGGGLPREMSLAALREVAMPGGDVPLMPGELFFGGAPARLTTLLGACASVTVWHPPTRCGGICHYLLPKQPVRGTRLDGRFGDEALELLTEAVMAAGLDIVDCQIKLFGGGGLLANADGPPSLRIGENNIEHARQWASRRAGRISAEHVGGDGYRRISFDLDTGQVHVWYTPSVSLAWAGAAARETL